MFERIAMTVEEHHQHSSSASPASFKRIVLQLNRGITLTSQFAPFGELFLQVCKCLLIVSPKKVLQV